MLKTLGGRDINSISDKELRGLTARVLDIGDVENMTRAELIAAIEAASIKVEVTNG